MATKNNEWMRSMMYLLCVECTERFLILDKAGDLQTLTFDLTLTYHDEEVYNNGNTVLSFVEYIVVWDTLVIFT